MVFKEKIKLYFQEAQARICAALEVEDGKGQFGVEEWSHASGGGGITRVVQHGHVLEKGGVNFSAVEGEIPVFMKNHVAPTATHFFATGISIVLHPHSPLIPIIHMNVRYFETNGGDAWFGGGIDLTPIYVVKEDARDFHLALKNVCDRYDTSFYANQKKWADDYFFNQHRNETRGVGGIFYDYIKPSDGKFSHDELLNYALDLTQTFVQVYVPLMAKYKAQEYSPQQKEWQLVRRGRYVEFNLVYDRGTRFGLETKGRIESILMSLPEHASWKYNFLPEENSDEWRTQELLKKGINWIEVV
jgi:coproporphyrinogen III oxidase